LASSSTIWSIPGYGGSCILYFSCTFLCYVADECSQFLYQLPLPHSRVPVGLDIGCLDRDRKTQTTSTHRGINLPPNQCLPLNSLTPSLGAVKLNSTSGSNVFTSSPFVSLRGCRPESTSHPEGMSMLSTGRRFWSRFLVLEEGEARWLRIVWYGGRTGGWKEKPIRPPRSRIESK
jgi:hypothetical protein